MVHDNKTFDSNDEYPFRWNYDYDHSFDQCAGSAYFLGVYPFSASDSGCFRGRGSGDIEGDWNIRERYQKYVS